MTTSRWIDLLLVLLLVGGAAAGWRRGGLRLAASVIGLVLGLALGLALVPQATAALAGNTGWPTGTTVWLVTLLGVLLGAGVGRWFGGLVSAVAARLHLSLLDRIAGAGVGVALTAALIGAGLTLVTTGPGAAGQWLTTARASSVGTAATAAAERALELVPALGAAAGRSPGGTR